VGTRLHAVRRSLVVLISSLATVAAATFAYADGIDVSHWQGTISWSKVKSDGTQFAFMKATESHTYYDKTLPTNWAGAKAVGIHRGAYHFARPGSSSAATQARYFVTKTGSLLKEKGALPPVLDLETSGGLGVTKLRAWTSDWLRTVEDLTGRTPIIYVSPAFWEYYLGNSTAFTRYPLWLAHYTTGKPRVPGGWSRYTFWQYTSSGRVSGIGGNVDENKFNGTTADLARLAQTSGGTTAPAAPGPTVPVGAATRLTLVPSHTQAAITQSVALSGDLTTVSDGAPVAGRTVELFWRSVGSTAWTRAGTATTDAVGHWRVSRQMPRTMELEARAAGDATWAAAVSPRVRVTTPPRSVVTVDLKKDKSVVRKGRPVMIYGHTTVASNGLANLTVRYYKKPLRGGRWERVRSTTSLAPTGWHSTVIRPRRNMLWKAVSVGTLQYLSDTSNVVTVRVR
jgi:GH25 family lysozyme M1 (1,4-beta-N-acetylmuramidase)